MKSIAIKGNTRTEIGKKASRDQRISELIPCILYGGKENVSFTSHRNNFNGLIFTPNSYIVELDIDGKTYRAVMQDLQYDTLSNAVSHIDFMEVAEGKPVVVMIPISTKGNSKGVLAGGKLKISKRHLKIRALTQHLPDVLDIDISELEIGSHIRIKDLAHDNIEFVESGNTTIISVLMARAVAVEEAKTAAKPAAAKAAAPAAAAKAGDAKAAEAKPAAKKK